MSDVEYQLRRQAEDRVHRVSLKPVAMVYLDIENGGLDGRLRVLIDSKGACSELNLPGVCECEFDEYDDGDTEESYHYKRTCLHCGHQWFGLHCPHDGHQNPCPGCDVRPTPIL